MFKSDQRISPSVLSGWERSDERSGIPLDRLRERWLGYGADLGSHNWDRNRCLYVWSVCKTVVRVEGGDWIYFSQQQPSLIWSKTLINPIIWIDRVETNNSMWRIHSCWSMYVIQWPTRATNMNTLLFNFYENGSDCWMELFQTILVRVKAMKNRMNEQKKHELNPPTKFFAVTFCDSQSLQQQCRCNNLNPTRYSPPSQHRQDHVSSSTFRWHDRDRFRCNLNS